MAQTTWLAMVVTTALLALPSSASATLGGDTASVEADRVRAQGALLRIVRSDAFTVNEVQASSGTTIREYTSSSGTVFAVAWEGPWLPNLRQSLVRISRPTSVRFKPVAPIGERVARSRSICPIWWCR